MTWGEAGRVAGLRPAPEPQGFAGIRPGSFALLTQRLYDASVPPPGAHPKQKAARSA